MKNIVTGLVVFFLAVAGATVFAQRAKPLDHAKKVYLDSATAKIYIPDKTPLYLRLALSPEEGGKTYLLRNSASKAHQVFSSCFYKIQSLF